MTCKHKFEIKDEHYISEGCIRIKLECNKCKTTFEGIIYEK